MTELKHLKFEKAQGVARITLNRPKFNMMNIAMMAELNGRLEDLLNDNDLKCLAIYAEGKHFCTGVEVADHKPGNVNEMIAVFNRIFELTEGRSLTANIALVRNNARLAAKIAAHLV